MICQLFDEIVGAPTAALHAGAEFLVSLNQISIWRPSCETAELRLNLINRPIRRMRCSFLIAIIPIVALDDRMILSC